MTNRCKRAALAACAIILIASADGAQAASVKMPNIGGPRMLNPQPMPPRVNMGSLAGPRMLNPQPLPPKAGIRSLAGSRMLSPQPLPPRVR